MSGSALRAVFFDVGNTLLYASPSVSEVCRSVLERAGHFRDISVIDSYMPLVDAYYEERYAEDDGFWADEERTSSVWVGMYSLLCRQLGIENEAVAIARHVYDEFGRPDRWALYDDVRPAFERLRERGLAVGVISNWDSRLQGLLEGLGLGDVLSDIVGSADVGLHKPDPRIFALACERLGVQPEEAAHVGDHHYADYLGSTALGMRAVLIDRHGVKADHGVTPITTFDVLEGELGL
ncbi:HAD family hydrolase [Anaerosoma tenue]|uniref:HAD family hydrolase n=1 Tax=Anaerosoma tenue TaxID=2933588 RepID=UPI002260EEC9|nr:HAD-IA family hydrolase [Anaerosoma tenue]MCK8113953.1 HAD-IA family hydrolase [Anaerosoma tenue]